MQGTGWPIDGRVLYFSQWDYDDRRSWHLYGWDDPDDEAVMLTMYQTAVEAGFEPADSLESFTAAWKAKQWEAPATFCVDLDKVDVLEVMQEEQKDAQREKLRAFGIDISPRKSSDRGGILCLPLDKNLNGDTQGKHADWKPMQCPNCGRKCWKPPTVDQLVEKQGVQLLCTECALKAGLIQPYQPNRAERRR